MSGCEQCGVSAVGDVSAATPGAVGSVRWIAGRWVWHAHSLPTHFNHGNGYTVDGSELMREAAVEMMEKILDIAAVAFDEGRNRR